MSDLPAPAVRGRAGSILRNVSSNWAAFAVNILLSFFVAPFVVASLGDVYYGIWTLLNQFTGYLWLFDFGVRESVIKYVAQYHASGEHEQLESTVNTSLYLYTAIAILTMIGTGAMAAALPYVFNIPAESVWDARVTLLLTGGAIAQGFVVNVFVGVLMGLRRYYLVSQTTTIFAFIRTAFVILALKTGYGIVALGVVQFWSGLMVGLIVIWQARRALPAYRPRFTVPSREQFLRVFDYAKYVVGNNIGEKIIFSADAIVIGALMPVGALTFYAIAGSLVGYLRNFMLATAAVLNPESSALAARNEHERLSRLFMTASKATVLVGLPICIGFLILGERFIALWMGEKYGPLSGQVLGVLALAHLVGLPQYCICAILYGVNRHKLVARWRAVEAVLNLGLSVILVLRFGIIGAAFGTLLSHVWIAALALPLAIRDVVGLRLGRYYLSTYVRPLLAGLPFAAACVGVEWLAPQSLLTFAALGAAAMPVYAVSAWFLALTADERAGHAARLGGLLRKRAATPAAGTPASTGSA
jgi:O-antigen/teichoic acid export membrane protein